MKIFVTALFLILTPLYLMASDLTGRDKITHASVSFGGQVACASIATEITDKTTANVACAVAMLGAGIAVEYGALGKNQKDSKDVLANTVGIGLGMGVIQWKF